MPANPDVVDTNVPGEPRMPDTATTPVTEPMISVEVQDRLLRELKRRLFPSDCEGIVYSAITGDLYWQDQLWSLMVDTWPRLQTNLGKLKRAVSSVEYTVSPYASEGEKPTDSAVEKAHFVKNALFGMHGDVARQEHDFKETIEDIVDSIVAGFTVLEVYWESRDGGIVPQCSRWIPARYYRYPYVLDDNDRLMLNPSGNLGGTQLVDFPPYKFLVCIKQSHANHPVFTAPMRCLTAWWISSRFGLEWFQTFAQLFGIPQRIAYYQPGDDVVYQQLVNMMRQSASATWGVYPKGTDVQFHAHPGTSGAMPQERLIESADKVCDIMLLGQTLTTEVHDSGSRALGQVHRSVMEEIMEAAAIYCARTMSTQIVPGIVQYNYGNLEELPKLEPVINTPHDLFNMAQAFNILFNQMRIPVRKDEIYDRIEFSAPEPDAELYEPPGTQAAASPATPFGGGVVGRRGLQPEESGMQPPRGSNGESKLKNEPASPELALSANGHDDPDIGDNDDGGEDPIVVPTPRKVSFALDYGEEPEPGETLRFALAESIGHFNAPLVEARNPHRDVSGKFSTRQKAAFRIGPSGTKLHPQRWADVGRFEAEDAESAAVESYFENNAAHITGVHWRSVLDDRTTVECRDLAGKKWTYPELTPIGHDTPFPTFPPAHYNCRSHVLPIIRVKVGRTFESEPAE